MGWLLPTILVTSLAGFSADEVRQATGDVLSDDRYQTTLPDESEGQPAARPAATPSRPPRRRVSDPVSDISSALMWVLMAVIFGVFAVWIGTQFRSYERDGGARARDPVDEGEVAATASPLQDDAAALARAGRFDEAVHALLLRALALLRASRPGGLPDSLTSREVLHHVPLGSDEHDALGGLIATVERSLFGGRRLGRADYDACAAYFDAFAGRRGRRAVA